MVPEFFETPGVLERDNNDPANYRLYNGHPAFSYVWNVCLSINAMIVAVSSVKEESVPEVGSMPLACKAFDCTIKLPGTDSVQMAIGNRIPDSIPLWFEPERDPDRNSSWASPVSDWVDYVVLSGFVDFYATHERLVEQDRALSKMARMVRNAAAHGRLVKNVHRELVWREVSIRPETRPQPLANIFSRGDILVLALHSAG